MRDDPSRVLRSGLLVAIETGVLLARMGVMSSPHQGHARTVIAHWLSSLLGIVFWIGLGAAVLEKYVDVVERRSEFGLLRILGASKKYLVSYVLEEIVVASIPGAIFGLAFAYLVSAVFGLMSSELVSFAIPIRWWPAAAGFAMLAPLTGAVAAIPPAMKEGITEAL
jgi:putative ABC transport system permease protein